MFNHFRSLFDRSDILVVPGCMLLWLIATRLNNEVIFTWSAVTDYRHWIFVPAGIKLVVAMVFRWRGALGVTLGISVDLPEYLPILSMPQTAILAVAHGFAPLAAVGLFSHWTGLRMPWHGLQGHHLPGLALLSASLGTLAFQLLIVAFGIEHWPEALPQMLIMIIGDFVGAGLLLIMLVVVSRLLRRFRGSA